MVYCNIRAQCNALDGTTPCRQLLTRSYQSDRIITSGNTIKEIIRHTYRDIK